MLEKKIRDIPQKPLTLIQKNLQENQEKLSSFNSDQAKLEGELTKLSEKLESAEVIQAKINVLTRQAEEALAGNKPQRAEELKSQMAKIREYREITIAEIKTINEKIALIQSERRVFVNALLQESHPRIKETFGLILQATVAWIEREMVSCEQVAGEAGITLPGSFFNEMRIFREGSRGGSRDWRPLRDSLDRWVPVP